MPGRPTRALWRVCNVRHWGELQLPAACNLQRDANSSREDSWPGASLTLCLSDVGLREGWDLWVMYHIWAGHPPAPLIHWINSKGHVEGSWSQ